MQRYNNTVVNPTGQAIANAQIVVTIASNPPGTGAAAQVFGDDGVTPVSNVVFADNLGRFGFFVPDGKYDLKVSGGTPLVSSPYILAAVEIVDLLEFNPLDQQPIAVQTLNLTELPAGVLPATNTINLYSKQVDSRLYYKDSTGVEIGPLLSGGGGGSSAGSAGTLQSSDGLGGFHASALVETGGILDINEDVMFQGPSPYIDAREFGMRGTNPNGPPVTPGGVTATTAAGSTAVATSGPTSLFRNGDGVVIWGAGATTTLATPTTPTVTPSVAAALTGTFEDVNAPTGSTVYNYQVVARTRMGGLTAAGPVGTTTTGAASLGPQNINNVSLTASAHIVTMTTATPHALSVGAMVRINGMGLHDGWFIVTSVPGSTQYTYQNTLDTRDGFLPAAAGGGTTTYWNCNRISWTPITGAFQYYIYGRTGGSLSLIGVSWPQNTTLYAANDPINGCSFDDYGPPYTVAPILPQYVPNTAPSVAINEMFASTIVSGAGTASLVLANPALNAASNATFLLDNGPTLLAAANQARNSFASLYLAGSQAGPYVINSPVTLPGLLEISQGSNSLYLNETLQVGTVQWWGVPSSGAVVPSFGFHPSTGFQIGRAIPGVYNAGGQNVFFHYMGFASVQNSNGSLLLFMDGATQAQIPGSEFDRCQFTVSPGGTDYTGHAIVTRGDQLGNGGQAPIFMDWVGMPTSQNTFSSSTVHPIMVCIYSSNLVIKNLFLSGKGLYTKVPTPGGTIDVKWCYTQAGYEPLFSVRSNINGISTSFRGKDFTLDTTFTPIYANLGATLSLGQFQSIILDTSDSDLLTQSPNGAPLYTGAPLIRPVDVSISSSFDGTFGQFAKVRTVDAHLLLNPGYAIYSGTNPAPAPTVVMTSTGGDGTNAVPIGSVAYRIIPQYITGSQGTPSLSAFLTVTAPNQTANISWAPVQGAVAYNIARSTGGGGYSQIANTGFVLAPTTSTVDTKSFTQASNGGGLAAGGPAGIKGATVYGDFLLSTGGLSTAIRTKTTNYTTVTDDSVFLADATTGPFTITLNSSPSITVVGQLLRIKKIDATANPVLIRPSTGTLDTAASFSLTSPLSSIDVQFDGTNWWIL